MLGTTSSADGSGTTHRKMLGGLLESVPGLALFLLSLVYLFGPGTGPDQVAGVMLPLTMSIPGLAFGLRSLIRLRQGITPQSLIMISTAWFLIGGLAALVTVAEVIHARTSWALLAVLPLAVSGTLIVSAFTQRRIAARWLEQ